jgi:hypothetical protein
MGTLHEAQCKLLNISRQFLAENQLDAPLLIDLFILFCNSLHVSGSMCPSSGDTKLY